jgi:hypothetical protein
MAAHIRRGGAQPGRVGVTIEHVCAARKRRLALIIRLVGLARAAAMLGLGNLVTRVRAEIARRLGIGRSRVYRVLAQAGRLTCNPLQAGRARPSGR